MTDTQRKDAIYNLFLELVIVAQFDWLDSPRARKQIKSIHRLLDDIPPWSSRSLTVARLKESLRLAERGKREQFIDSQPCKYCIGPFQLQCCPVDAVQHPTNMVYGS